MLQTPRKNYEETTGPMATKARESRKPITEPNDLKKPRNRTAAPLASNKSIHKKATNIVRTKNTRCKSSRCSPLSS